MTELAQIVARFRSIEAEIKALRSEQARDRLRALNRPKVSAPKDGDPGERGPKGETPIATFRQEGEDVFLAFVDPDGDQVGEESPNLRGPRGFFPGYGGGGGAGFSVGGANWGAVEW